MRKKLTILGALTALTIGALGIFQNGTATGTPIQTFSTAGIDWVSCYVPKDPGYPTSPTDKHPNYPDPDGGALQSSVCDAGSLADPLPTSTNVDTFTLITLPAGSRLALPTTFTPGEWGNVAMPCTVDVPTNECTDGIITGNVTSRVDLGCGIGGVGTQDILADSGVGYGTGGPIAGWPNDNTWTPPPFVRTSQNAAVWGAGGAGSGEPTGGPNAYTTQIQPFPPTATFSAIDTANLTTLWINGTGPLILPSPVLLQTASYESGYPGQAGLGMSVALLGGQPSVPPNDNTADATLPPDIQCLDTPQNSASANNTLVTPAAGTLAVRWQVTISAADLRDPVQDRILVWECRNTAGAPADADGDCLTDAADPNDADTDTDNDGVPDGVEVEIGAGVSTPDGDTDGATDYDEIFQFTDPTDPDSDTVGVGGDGQLDRQDLRPTNTCQEQTVFTSCNAMVNGNNDVFETADDNCPNELNALQENSDSNNDYHGMPGNTGDMMVASTNTASEHWTNPDEDILGDACDTDDDNDALGDVSENPSATTAGGTTIGQWRVGGGLAASEGSTLCQAPSTAGAAAPAVPLLVANGDSDNDLVLDGRECQFRSRPDSNARVGAACPAAIPVAPAPAVAGCGQPNNSHGGCGAAQDPDSDGLCLPRSAGVHFNLERQFRTTGININSTTQVNDTDGCNSAGESDIDSDNDTIGAFSTGSVPPWGGGTCPAVWMTEPGTVSVPQFPGLTDGDEVLYYNTSPTEIDSDRDGCPDGEEVSDVNGSGSVNAGDQIALGAKILAHPDTGGDGSINVFTSVNFDINKDGNVNAGDQQLMGRALGSPGNCPVNATNGVSGDLPATFGDGGLSGAAQGETVCGAAVDDDGDGFVNDGCAAVGPAEVLCSDALDNDADLAFNDGCPPRGLGGATKP